MWNFGLTNSLKAIESCASMFSKMSHSIANPGYLASLARGKDARSMCLGTFLRKKCVVRMQRKYFDIFPTTDGMFNLPGSFNRRNHGSLGQMQFPEKNFRAARHTGSERLRCFALNRYEPVSKQCQNVQFHCSGSVTKWRHTFRFGLQ